MPKIKVLHFYGSSEIGGGQQRAQFYLLKALSDDEDIITCCAILGEKGYYIDKIKQLGIPIIHINMRNGFDLRFKKNSRTI